LSKNIVVVVLQIVVAMKNRKVFEKEIAFGADVAGGLYGGYSLGEAVKEAGSDYNDGTSYKDPENGDGGFGDRRLW
jgi:hypothetical protein